MPPDGTSAKMNQEDIPKKITELRDRCTNLVLATVGEGGRPLASQTPFAVDEDGSFLVLVSGLAEHGKTLRSAKTVNVMLMVDEAGLPNPFARERLNLDCNVETIARESKDWAAAERLLENRFGKFINTLVQLPDFTIFRLLPQEGRYVAGFGAAYRIIGNEIEPIRG